MRARARSARLRRPLLAAIAAIATLIAMAGLVAPSAQAAATAPSDPTAKFTAAAEKELTSRSDIYSLGCVLYEMLVGSPPHVGATAQQIVMKIVMDTVRPVTELRKSVPLHVAAAVRKAVEKLPADRFATAADFARALENPGYAATTVISASRRAAEPPSRRAAFTALAALTLDPRPGRGLPRP